MFELQVHGYMNTSMLLFEYHCLGAMPIRTNLASQGFTKAYQIDYTENFLLSSAKFNVVNMSNIFLDGDLAKHIMIKLVNMLLKGRYQIFVISNVLFMA